MRPTSSRSSRRSPLFDLWRGLALVDMAWVHLALYPIGMPAAAALWIGETTRFAAGFFVMLAGLTVRLAFGAGLASADTARRGATVRRLLRRALLLLFVDRLAGVAFAAIEALLRSGPGPSFEPDRLLAIATFQQPGATGGLLVLYTMLLALTAPLEHLRSRAGAPVVVALSLAVFALAQGIGAAAHWPPWTFPLAHWQPLFVAGYLATPHLDRLRDAGGRIAGRWLALAAAGYAVVFVLRNGAALGLPAGVLPQVVFLKVPLSAAELGWYAWSSAFVLLGSASLFERSVLVQRRTAWLRRLGRWSLVIYVAHLLVELPIIAVLTWLDPSPVLRTTGLVAMVVALDAIARAADWTAARRASAATRIPVQAMLRRLVPVGGVVGGTVAAACAAIVLATPPAQWARERYRDAAPALEPQDGEAVALDAFATSLIDAYEDALDEDITLLDAGFETPDIDIGDAGDPTDAAPGEDAGNIASFGDAEFTVPAGDFEDGLEEFPTSTLPFGERPIEELIDDELEPVAN